MFFHIIWQGKGYKVFLIYMVCFVLLYAIVNELTGSEQYLDEHDWPLAVSFIVSGVIFWFYGVRLDKEKPSLIMDKETGEELEFRQKHTFFWIPVKWWGLISIILAFIAILNELQVSKRANENLTYINEDAEYNYYWDAENVSVDGDTRTIWLYENLKKPRRVDNKIIYTLKIKNSINCTKRTSRLLETELLDSKGKVQIHDSSTDPPDPIPPNTYSDQIRESVCSIKNNTE